MEAKVREVMDDLFGGKITFQEALEMLNVSPEELHRMIGRYEYTPTAQEMLEANMIMIENLEYIEREISISCKRSTQSKAIPSSAAGVLEKTSDVMATSSVADTINIIKPKDSAIPTTSIPHNPFDLGYFG